MPIIIKEGILPEEIDHQTTCKSCGTIFQFKISEIEHKDRRDGWRNLYDSILCPFCANRCCLGVL